MKHRSRYFDVVGQKQVFKLSVIIGSLADTASPERIAKEFKLQELREIDQKEYAKLGKVYVR